MKIIGLSGKAGCGKDFLQEKYFKRLGYKQFSMAWHMKAFCIGAKQLTFDEAFITKKGKARTILQMAGTEFGRDLYGQDIWCNAVEAWFKIFDYHWGEKKFTIPDIRFPNEVKMVRRLNGLVIRVKAPKREAERPMDDNQLVHSSETSLEDWHDTEFDGVINNDPEHEGTLAEQIHLILTVKKFLNPDDVWVQNDEFIYRYWI